MDCVQGVDEFVGASFMHRVASTPVAVFMPASTTADGVRLSSCHVDPPEQAALWCVWSLPMQLATNHEVLLSRVNVSADWDVTGRA